MASRWAAPCPPAIALPWASVPIAPEAAAPVLGIDMCVFIVVPVRSP